MEQGRITVPIRQYGALLVDYLRPQKGSAVLLAVLLLGSMGLQLANPQIVRYFLDAAEASDGLDRLLGAAGLFMGVALLRHMVHIAGVYVGQNVAWTATNLLRADLALHCLRLDMSFHKKYKPGELIERVDGDVNQLAGFFSQLVLKLFGNLLLAVGIVVLLILQNWLVGVVVAGVAVVGALTLHWLNRLSVPRWQALREANAQLFGFVEEWLNGTEEIRTCGAGLYVMRRLYQSLRQRWQKILAAMRIQVLVNDLPFGVFALAYVAAHILGYTLFRNSEVTVGEVYLLFYYIDMLKGPLWEILHHVEGLQQAVAGINRIVELRQIQPTIHDGPGAICPPGPLAVAFEDVTFCYEDDTDTNVLEHVTFALQPGTVLGLLGRTGSGKSTLTRLLSRIYDPAAGVIRLGSAPLSLSGRGVGGEGNMFDIRQARQVDLRRCVGVVTQEVQLFQATVRQNLTLFDDTVPDARIRQVVEQVGLGDWLDRLPGGLDATLEGGGGLSAGEAQLLAFARVFLADPGLVILDEASSRLDPATERRIEKAIDNLLADRTGIIVAHRLATVQRADEIMILENGHIVEHGPRLALAGDPGSRFYHLLQTGLEEVMA
ncbi:MAG: ABC transporter ATP-binding protein [Anaerolineae bacterium]|nr:ABC transporter ATP-binding protein [Anaerolineae bacterium]